MSMGSSKPILCRLCLNIINDIDVEVMEDIIRGILQDVLPRLDLETKDKHMMCRTCHVNLIAAYNFKSMCIDTEDVILSYTNREQIAVVELKDVYLKEKRNVQLIDMSENQKICRLCMQLVAYEYGFVSLNEVDVDIINKYIPQVNINATKDPVICGLCFDSLRTHSSFVKNCLEAQEQYAQSYIKTEEIDIKTEGADQDSDFSSHDLFDGTIKNNKRKHVSEDSGEIIVECMHQCEAGKSPVDAPSIKGESKNEFNNDVNSKNGLEPTRKGTNVTTNVINKPSRVMHKKLCVKYDSSEIQKYKCDMCSYESKHKHCIQKHQLTHKNPSEIQMHKCDVCNYETKYKSDLIVHQVKHKDPSEILMYKCDVCSCEFKRKDHLKQHQVTHKDPSEIRMYKCDLCSYESKRKHCLKKHQLTHKNPSDISMNHCDLCNYETKYKSDLKVHQLTHKDPSEVQMYKCEVCSYEAKHKNYLKLHQLVHEDKMYNCDECSYKTKSEKYLQKHHIMHKNPSEIQMYNCDVCSYTSKYKNNIKKHQLTHKNLSEIEMYKCDRCSYESKHKNHLKRHQLTHRDPSEVQM